MTDRNGYLVAVVGAGPAGLFAARALADGGCRVVVLNRDIKPGGLAEYGIYFTKHKMKEGLRKQFRDILGSENVDYYGNVTVGDEGADLALGDLLAFGFDAVLVAAGAQGTKWLGLPGEDLEGVYHAKDLVYHYNRLPPYSEQEFPMGQRVAIVGVGNVMVDIAHYAVRVRGAAEVMAVARRGPGERKYTDKEIGYVLDNWDIEATRAELERIRERVEAAGQDVETLFEELTVKPKKKAVPKETESRMWVHWLSSPAGILGDEDGKVRALLVDDTEIYPDGGRMKVRKAGTQREIACDTVVFAIGDKVDERLGLVLNRWGEFAVSEEPRFPVNGTSYEAAERENVFLAGWSREASTGLVGAARKDGTSAAEAVLQYLDTVAGGGDVAGALERLQGRLDGAGHVVVDKTGWQKVEQVEAAEGARLNVEGFKFASNAEMLAAIAGE